jgi:hypothetical protein
MAQLDRYEEAEICKRLVVAQPGWLIGQLGQSLIKPKYKLIGLQNTSN